MSQLVRDSTYERLGHERDRASNALGSFAGAIRSMAAKLRDEGHGPAGGYLEKAAGHVDQWASGLRERDVQEAVRQIEQFARRQPGLFFGAAFTIGVLGARFLKSSPPSTFTGPEISGGVL